MKKQYQLTILILFGLTIFYSCQKENIEQCSDVGCIIFEGNVFDKNNDKPIDSALIEVIYFDGSFINTSKIVGKSTSDQDGDFVVSFLGDRYKNDVGYFQVEISKSGYLTRERNFFTIDSTSFDVPQIVDGNILPKSQLDLMIKTGIEIEDFKFGLLVGYQPTLHILNNSSSIDTIYRYEVAGDQYVNVSYEYMKDGSLFNLEDSVYIDSGNLGEVELNID